jgi:predicted dehydrogenase
VRVAVVGLGSIGTRHARNLTNLGHEVIGFDPVRRAHAQYAIAASMHDAVSASDAVLVASPTSLHADHARYALERGRPVLVEKPLAAEVSAAQRLAVLADARGLVCGVAMNLRFHPGVLALRDLLAQDALGQIRYAHVWSGSDLRTWRPGSDYRKTYSARAELGGGVVRDCIHELDYLTWLLGPAISVSAEVARVSELEIDVEDLAVAVVRLASGALASLDLTYVDPSYRRGCLLVGSSASARWDWTLGTIEIAAATGGPERVDVAADVADTYVAEIQDFIAAVQTGRPPRTSADEGVAAVKLADAVLRSARDGRRLSL